MAAVDYISFNIFVLIATFTPGPGNIASAGMGMAYGYRKTFRFILGIAAGYLLVMTLSAFLASSVIRILPKIEPVFRSLGSLYILWLAYKTSKSSSDFSTEAQEEMRIKQGFLIQALNPKALIFGLSIYTSFLAGLSDNTLMLWISSLYLASITFLSVSLWAFGGSRIQKYLHIPAVKKWSGIILTFLLIYCALMISGLLSLLKF